MSPGFKGSYEGVYGRHGWPVKFQDGTPVWDYYDDVWYLKNHVTADTPFITFGNGKLDGGIGWPQAVDFIKALQETHRPHLAVWRLAGHGVRCTMPGPTYGERNMPLDLRTDLSLPAFTRCSLDDDPGSGTRLAEPRPVRKTPRGQQLKDPFDGDSDGQINRYLGWQTKDIEDTPDAWAMTVVLWPDAPEDTCTVDITPRRCQRFKPKAGQQFTWTNTSVADGKRVGSGTVTADKWGLVTLEQVTVGKGKNRIVVARR
jgi:hypothetical protein